MLNTTCEWVPASKPPRPGELVLATDGIEFYSAIYNGSLGANGGFGVIARRTKNRTHVHWVEGITHWTLFPEFPKR